MSPIDGIKADVKGKVMKIIWALFVMCLFIPAAYAKTQYVTDVLYITLRTGPGDEFKVLKAMKTGTKLQVIEENEDGYSLVSTQSGLEGWARSKYLVDEPVAALKLDGMQKKMDLLRKENAALKKKNTASKEKIKELEKDRKRLESTNSKLKSENTKMKKIAAKPMALAKLNDELKAVNEANESRMASLEEENAKYKDSSGRDWFLAGGGVLFFGLIVGLILPSIRWNKNKDWA